MIIERDAWALSGFTAPDSKQPKTSIKELRDSCAAASKQVIVRLNSQYAVDVEHQIIAGIGADIVTPKLPIPERNRNRVLINLHGGGWIGRCPDGLVESIPIAATGNIKVITIDYRMAPENRHPAASEDVATVYKTLLAHYNADNIGIYGCSAGGYLSAQATAWIINHGLPRPGAIGNFCGAMTWGLNGDSNLTVQFIRMSAIGPIAHHMTYFQGADPNDPMVSPALSLELLAKFPPVLFVTATRDAAMSGALFAHNQLAKAGVDSELRVWDGLWHSFLFDDLPEARDANEIIVNFFDKHLGVAPMKES